MTRTKIIAIAGGSGSGKTYLANAIFNKLGDNNSFVLYQDSYYHDQSHRFDHDGGSVNFDHPQSIDFPLLCSHLRDLKENKEIQIPQYDFASHKRISETKLQAPKPIVLVDGILILCHPELREIFDEIIFVHAPETVRFSRRLERDVRERGRTEEGVRNQFSAQVKPMHDQFVEPSSKFANLLSSGTDIKELNNTIDYVTKLI